MSNTVYLIELESSMGTKQIKDGIVDLFNARNAKYGISLDHGSVYNDMYELLKDNEPIKGKGYFRTKDGIRYWVLPFESHPLMGQFNDVVVLTSDEFKSYEWDVEGIDI